jgi:hypothetical protein
MGQFWHPTGPPRARSSSSTRWPPAVATPAAIRTRWGRPPRARLVRSLECTAGRVEVALEFAPQPEYGLVEPLLAAAPGGVVMRGGADVLALSCPVPLSVDHRAATGTLTLRAGEHATLGLTHRTTSEPYPVPPVRGIAGRGTARNGRRLAGVVGSAPGLPGPWRDLVHHSGRVCRRQSYTLSDVPMGDDSVISGA